MAQLPTLVLSVLLVLLGLGSSAMAREVRVTPAGNLQQVLAMAKPGDVIRVAPGTYRGNLAITVPRIQVIGEGLPILDGEGKGTVITIVAEGVTLRGFRITQGGSSPYGSDAGVKVSDAGGCVLEDNVIDRVFNGIYLKGSEESRIRRNQVTGAAPSASFDAWGDGIRLWSSPGSRLEGNRVSQFRDGFYLDFSPKATLADNQSFENRRYGLHFMFMNESRFTGNRFERNQAGTVLMYSKQLLIEDNVFADNRGHVGSGILFKENNDSRLEGNRILNNTVGMFIDGSNRNRFEGNIVAANGWGVHLFSSSIDNVFTRNAFSVNDFDVAVDMRISRNLFDGNHWSAYEGYDLDGNGQGDVPHSPVSMFSYLTMRYPDLSAFVGSPAVKALAFAQRLFPVLSPSALQDAHPVMSHARLADDSR